MKLWEVFSKLKTEKDVNVADIARATGLPYTTIDSIEKKKLEDMRYSNASAIAKYFSVPVEYLYNGRYPDKALSIKEAAAPYNIYPNSIRIPVLGSIPAGVAVEAIEDIVGWEEVPEEWLSGGREYFGLTVKGDSMYPEYLDGDTVIVRKQDCCDSGDDCIVMIDAADATLKRVKLLPDGLELVAVNKMYGKKKYTAKEILDIPVTILGVVVELRRKKK